MFKDGFESMTENILEPLTEQSHSELRWYLSDLSSEKLNVLLQQLLEFIIFTLDQGQGDAVSYTYRYLYLSYYLCYMQIQLHLVLSNQEIYI